MIECWPGRRTSFMRSGMCVELWSGQGERERLGVAIGKSACFDVEAVLEIEGVKAGPTRSHIVLRNLRVERSKSRTRSGSSDSSTCSGPSLEFELALVFEKPGRYTLPIFDITRIRCKNLHQGKASIETRDSLFLLSAASQIELERLLEVIKDVKAVKTLADSRVCAACKERAERKKVKLKREQLQPTDFVSNSRLDGDCPAAKKQKVKVLECLFRKKQLPGLVETVQEQVHLRDLLKRRERDEYHASHRLNGTRFSPTEGSEDRPIELDEEVYYKATVNNGAVSPEGTKHNNAVRISPVQTKTREAYFLNPNSPIQKVIFIDEMRRTNLADAARMREAQRIVSERRSDIERGVSVRSGDEKENFEVCLDEDLRKIGEEPVNRFADEGPSKVREGPGRGDDANRRNEERRMLDAEIKRQSEQDMMVKRKESLRKFVEQEGKWKEEWEAKREEDDKKLKAEEERVKKSLERRLQEEDRRRKEENKKEEENRKVEERRKKGLDRILQEEKRRRIEEERRVQELKQREEEGKRAREAERKLQELKQREEEGKRAREAERKLQELKQREEEGKRAREAERKLQELKQREEERKRAREAERKLQELKQKEEEDKRMKEAERNLAERKQAEEKVKEALKFFKFEGNRQESREPDELKNFQEAVKNTIRISQRGRSRVFEEARMPTEESRNTSEEQRDKLDQRKLDEDMRRWRTEENHRRAKEDGWTISDQERSFLEEQRKRVEEVMNMSKRLHRKMGEFVKDEATEGTKDGENLSYKSKGKRGSGDEELPNLGFHERAFLDQFPNMRDNQKARTDEEKRLRKEGEWFNLTELFAKPCERARQEELKKQELQRKKAAKAADDQKKKLAQERLKAAKVEAKRLEKLLKEAQKRAKAEERVRQQQKAQEQTRQKLAANASARFPGVHHLTYQQYEDSWHMMKMSEKSLILGYSDIPWPPHDNPLFFEAGDSLAAQRRKLRIALLRWHPDKFVALCGNRLSPLERECIEARAKSLAQEVILWKSKLDNIS